MKKPNCQKITSAISTIKSKRDEFDVVFSQGEIEASLKIRNEIEDIVQEIKDKIWPLEILTKENIEKQYDEWEDVYLDMHSAYNLPSKERLFEFFKSDPEFLELMKIKEKQGLTKLILAPAPSHFSLKNFVDRLDSKILNQGGEETVYSGVWGEMFSQEDLIYYFGTVEKNDHAPIGGVIRAEIGRNPYKYGICDKWLVSFTTNERNILRSDSPDLDTGNGRKAIKRGLRLSEYFNRYFKDNDETYKGEEPMLPQEHIAIFAKEVYGKYYKTGKEIGIDHDLMDSDSATWFIGTYLSKEARASFIRWNSQRQQYYCGDISVEYSDTNLGVRSVVRRKSK